MKHWTVVIQINDDGIGDFDASCHLSRQEIEALVMKDVPAGISFQVMEVIEAPYGPLPDASGVIR